MSPSPARPARRAPESRGASWRSSSVLDPAEEPERRGTVFGFHLLGVRHDDAPDTPQLGDRVRVIVDAEVVVHARLPERGHEQRRRLLAPLVATRRLPRLERHEQPLGQIPALTVAGAKRIRHCRDHVGAGQHVARDRELVGLLVAAPRYAAGPGVAEGALAVEPVYLAHVALA